jgi:hypothetical protein
MCLRGVFDVGGGIFFLHGGARFSWTENYTCRTSPPHGGTRINEIPD